MPSTDSVLWMPSTLCGILPARWQGTALNLVDRATAWNGNEGQVTDSRQSLNRGVVELSLRRSGPRTVVQDAYFRTPLQIMRPYYLDDSGTAYIYLLSPGGGVVGGDRYAITVTLEAGARACMTTASATKLYASPDSMARQRFEAILQAGAVFEYLPEQIIPFARSAFQQDMTVRLGSGALAVLAEIVAPGRLARGEAFAFCDYSSGLSVTDAQGRALLRERTRLQPLRWDAGSGLGLLEGFSYLGTLYVLSASHSAPRELADALHGLVADRPRCIGGVTALEWGGVVVRLLAEDHATISRTLHVVWDRVRRCLLGYPAVRWRK